MSCLMKSDQRQIWIQFLTASSAHAVLNIPLLLSDFKVCENSVHNEGKLKHVDKTCWHSHNMLTKHADKTCRQNMLTLTKHVDIDKACWHWQSMLTKHVDVDKTCWQTWSWQIWSWQTWSWQTWSWQTWSWHTWSWQTWSRQTFFDMFLLAVWDWLSILLAIECTNKINSP